MIKSSPYDIVKNIMMTEKATVLKEQNQYAFKVASKATKLEVADAVAEIYGVKVKSVNMLNYKGKPKRSGRSPIPGRRADWKKAVVTLAEGSIDLA
jgi:large subunit ribosomal protein L23